jgi:uncharacterized protein
MGPDPLPAPAPEPDADSAPFWEGAVDDRLVVPRCRACDTVIWYPRSVCPQCHSTDVEWVRASGRGTVYSATVVHRADGAWAAATPYVIAYVELEEGPRVLTNITGAGATSIAIGDPVTAVFEPAGTSKLLRFRPTGQA